jgi:hypothetical protein
MNDLMLLHGCCYLSSISFQELAICRNLTVSCVSLRSNVNQLPWRLLDSYIALAWKNTTCIFSWLNIVRRLVYVVDIKSRGFRALLVLSELLEPWWTSASIIWDVIRGHHPSFPYITWFWNLSHKRILFCILNFRYSFSKRFCSRCFIFKPACTRYLIP